MPQSLYDGCGTGDGTSFGQQRPVNIEQDTAETIDQYFPRYRVTSHWLTCRVYSFHSSRLASRNIR